MGFSKKVLNIAFAFSLTVLSISVFIFSIKDNKAYAHPPASADSFNPVGVYTSTSKTGGEETFISIVGYNPATKEIKNIGSINRNNFFWPSKK